MSRYEKCVSEDERYENPFFSDNFSINQAKRIEHWPNEREQSYLKDGIIKAKFTNIISAVLMYKLENVHFMKYNRI